MSHNQLRLPNFFAGFSAVGTYDGCGVNVSNYDYDVASENESRGTVIALASRAPFNTRASGELLAGDKFDAAIDRALDAAARNVDHRGATGLADYLRGELSIK